MSTNKDLIGRDDVNDLEAILSITNKDVDAVVHEVGANLDAVFTWDYERSRTPLVKLYEKAKTSQWNASTDLDWSIDVDQEAVVLANAGQDGGFFSDSVDLSGTPFAKWTEKEWIQLGHRRPELDALAVPARRAGRVALHRAHRRDRAVDRRQVLRRDPGDGRSPSRRGVRARTSTRSSRVTTRSTRTCACCSTTSSPTAAGT